MTSEEFVRAVKVQASDAAVHGTVALLKRPPGRRPREKDLLLSEWYKRISEPDQRMVQQALKEAAELAVFEFFCVIDGVTVIEDAPQKGELEVYFVKGAERTRVNRPESEELHNIFNRLCDESLSVAVQNPDVGPGDSGDAARMKSGLKLGDEMDIHHAPDKHFSIGAIPGYHEESAPAVALRKSEHRKLPMP